MITALASPSCMEIYQMSSFVREKLGYPRDSQYVPSLLGDSYLHAAPFRKKKANLSSMLLIFESRSTLAFTFFYYSYRKVLRTPFGKVSKHICFS